MFHVELVDGRQCPCTTEELLTSLETITARIITHLVVVHPITSPSNNFNIPAGTSLKCNKKLAYLFTLYHNFLIHKACYMRSLH